MCSIGDARRVVQERDETQQIIAWLIKHGKSSSGIIPLRSATWLGTALDRRLNILRLEYPSLQISGDYAEALELLKQHYVPLEQIIVSRLSQIEQIYYMTLLPRWHSIVSILLTAGATDVIKRYSNSDIPFIVVYLSDMTLQGAIQSQIAINWPDAAPLFVIKMAKIVNVTEMSKTAKSTKSRNK